MTDSSTLIEERDAAAELVFAIAAEVGERTRAAKLAGGAPEGPEYEALYATLVEASAALTSLSHLVKMDQAVEHNALQAQAIANNEPVAQVFPPAAAARGGV